MTENALYSYSPDELDRLKKFRASAADFKELISLLPPEYRSVDHNRQFNELRSEGQALLKGPFADDVPEASLGGLGDAGPISMIVISGVILALVGLGINSIILDDVLINSLGCCVSSGGMLLIVGALGVLINKNIRGRTTANADLNYQCDLLLYQIDHRLALIGEYQPDTPETSDLDDRSEEDQ